MYELDEILKLLAFLKTLPDADEEFFVHDHVLNELIASHLPKLITKANYLKYGHLYLQRLHVMRSKAVNIIITGRQNGKTTMVALILVLLLVYGQNIAIEVFSLTRDQSQNVVRATKDFLRQIPSGYYNKVITENMNQVSVLAVNGNINILKSHSANPDASRGVAPDVTIVDEFGFMKYLFFSKMIMPLLSCKNRVLTAITTPGLPSNPISFFIQDQLALGANNNSMFNVINYSMVCSLCRDASIAEHCRHKMYLIPPWKSFWNIHTICDVSTAEEFLSEIMGESTGASNACYVSSDVLKCFDTSIVYTDNIIPEDNCIYITIDPTNGGDSDMCISSFIYNKNHEVVVRRITSYFCNFPICCVNHVCGCCPRILYSVLMSL